MRSLVFVCVGVAAILAVSTTATAQCDPATRYAEMFNDFLLLWGGGPDSTFHVGVLDGPDHNGDGIPDPYQVALIAAAVCANPAIEAVYEANLAAAQHLLADDPLGWGYPAEMAPQIAIEAMMDNAAWDVICWYYWYCYTSYYDWGTYQMTDAFFVEYPLTALPKLRGGGDLDGDGYTNLQEYEYMVARGASPTQYAYAASGGFAGQAVPVVGLVGLGLLAAACSVGGAMALRRKKS